MTEKRIPARIKRTKSGKILGRPPAGRGPTEPQAPRFKTYRVGVRSLKRVMLPSGEVVEAAGPPQPIFEVREVRRGRPKLKRDVAFYRIIAAQVAKRRSPRGIDDTNHQLALRIAEARGASDVLSEALRIERTLRDPTRATRI